VEADLSQYFLLAVHTVVERNRGQRRGLIYTPLPPPSGDRAVDNDSGPAVAEEDEGESGPRQGWAESATDIFEHTNPGFQLPIVREHNSMREASQRLADKSAVKARQTGHSYKRFEMFMQACYQAGLFLEEVRWFWAGRSSAIHCCLGCPSLFRQLVSGLRAMWK
jgi:hypothetical protein